MKIVIGADHAGYALKQHLIEVLKKAQHVVTDVGTNSEAAVDYPDFAEAVARKVAAKEAERGIVICGSGVGACIAANKIHGIRAGNCSDTYSAHQGVEHDDVNVLVLGSRVIGICLAEEILAAFLGAKFTGEERHVRRLNKIKKLEGKS